jgi:hypothetical protein
MVFLLTVLVATPALAGPPLSGTYKSTDLGGTILTGRYSESWAAPNGRLQLGNTTNKFSWNGAAGTQWVMSCAEISAAPLVLFDGVDANGNGQRIWQVQYSGGSLVLYAGGPWDNGDASYPATYASYVEVKTQTLVNHVVVGEVATVQLQASFDNYPYDCLALQIASSAEDGNTDLDGPLPANYPNFLEPGTCSATRTNGSWGDYTGITLDVFGSCTIAVEETTWGAIKAQYQD